MQDVKKINMSNNLANTQLASKKSMDEGTQVWDEKTHAILTMSELGKGFFQYSGDFPFITTALCGLCTMNPATPDGHLVIRGQDDPQATHYSARLKWDTLVDLATDGMPDVKESFHREFFRAFNKNKTLFVHMPNGYSVLTRPVIIKNIVYHDLTQMTKAEAERCAKIGITRKIAFVDIDFFKPLFSGILGQSNEGFISMDKAFYAKIRHTINYINDNPILKARFSRFRNPRTGEFIKEFPVVYYKYFLYLAMHIGGNCNGATTLQVQRMMEHVQAGQLDTAGHVKNWYNTKLFCDKAGMLFNEMAKLGYCEHTKGAITGSYYDVAHNEVRITYQAEKPRAKVVDYTSNNVASLPAPMNAAELQKVDKVI